MKYIYTNLLLFILIFSLYSNKAFSLTANKVWFDTFLSFYRIKIEYTIPELKELRTAEIKFNNYQIATKVYWNLIRGADFILSSKKNKIEFINQDKKPSPW